MDTYLCMLYVSLEQEKALKKFFLDNGWKYRKPDPAYYTDQIGPIDLEISKIDESQSPAIKVTSANKKQPVQSISTKTTRTKITRKKQNIKSDENEDVIDSRSEVMNIKDEEIEYVVDNDDDGDDDDDFIDDNTHQQDNSDNQHVAKLDGTVEDNSCQEEIKMEVREGTSVVLEDSTEMFGALENEWMSMSNLKFNDVNKESYDLHFFLEQDNDKSDLKGTFQFVCKQCGKKYATRSSLKRHILSHVPGRFLCSECHWYFVNEEKFKEHKEKFHQMSYKCKKCEVSLTRKSSLKKHVMRFHPESYDAKYKCTWSECKAVFDSENAYNCHLNGHANVKPFKCSHCYKSYSSSNALNAHMAVHGQDAKSVQCEDCGKIFKGNGALHNHRMSVHKNRRYKCDICDKVFNYPAGLAKHKQSHVKEKSKKKLGIASSNVKLRDLKNMVVMGEKRVKLMSNNESESKPSDNVSVSVESNDDKNDEVVQTSSSSEVVVVQPVAVSTDQIVSGQSLRDSTGVNMSVLNPESFSSYNVGEPILTSTTPLQGIQLTSQTGQIVWICKN